MNAKQEKALPVIDTGRRGDLQIGDIVERPLYAGILGNHRVLKKCRVVYIHPEGRFHAVEVECPRGKSYRVCFRGSYREYIKDSGYSAVSNPKYVNTNLLRGLEK